MASSLAAQSSSESELFLEKKDTAEAGEIEESPAGERSDPDEASPAESVGRKSGGKTVRTKVPEVEVHLFRQGKGPIEVFKSTLGGWDQDQLEVRSILDKYGFKSLFAFTPASATRGVPIRFQRNGRSILPYKDGSIIYVDGEPKDSLIKPVTRILLGVAVLTILITFTLKETTQWIQKLNIFGGNFPPWVLACVVIVFTRMRKRTRDVLKNRGW